MKKILSLLMSFSIFILLFSFVQQGNMVYDFGVNSFIETTNAAVRNIGRDVCDENPSEDGCDVDICDRYPGICDQDFPEEETDTAAYPSCRLGYDFLIDGRSSGKEYTPYTTNSNSYATGPWSLRETGKDDHCDDGSGCGPRVSVQCKDTSNYAIRVGYQYYMRGRLTSVRYTPWSNESTGDGPYAALKWGGQEECKRSGCQMRMFVETNNTNFECNIRYSHKNDYDTASGTNGSWAHYHTNSGDDEDCERDGQGCGMQAGLSCRELVPPTCTAGEIEEETEPCGSGFSGEQSRYHTCNEDGNAWSFWTDWDRSECVALTCDPGQEEDNSRDCQQSGYTGEETQSRTCNASGTAWGNWSSWDASACELEAVCTPGDIENGGTRACPTGYTGNETSTRTCNSTGTAWGEYVWDDTACVADSGTCTETYEVTRSGIAGEMGNCGGGREACLPPSRDKQAALCGSDRYIRTVDGPSRTYPGIVDDFTATVECERVVACPICTPDDVTTESVACGSGYTGNQTRTNTCNSSGTGYLGWTEYNRDNCVANECSPGEVGDELRACPTGFTGNETRDRTCDGTGSWGGWSDWNNSGCVADVCTANEVATETTACGSGYTGNQTRTNTCNGDGTAWNGWTSYDRTSCVENTPPTGTVSYTPAGPGWTTSDVVVAITCDDVGSGCDMVSSFPASWTYVDANTRSYTYSSNITSSVVLRDNAGNSTFIPYNIDYIDQSTPGAPTIAADDRGNNQWSDDNTTVVTTTINNTGEISSRYNQYCTDLSAGCTPSVTTPPSTTNLSDGIYYYRARTCTQAGRCGPIAEFIIKVDTTAPVASDLSVVPGMSGPLLANDNQNFQVTAGNAGGSNIVSIEGLFENYATENSYFTTPVVSTSDVLSFNGSTQLVDNNRSPQGYRNYQLYIYEICDEAGNCTREIDVDGIETFEYQVYPNTTALGVADVTINELDDTANIADGGDKEIIVTIEDVYGNNIIPASGIGRNISFDFTTDNSLYLNQYTRSGTSALYNGSNPWPIGNNLSRTFANQSSSDGTYDFSFSAYTPTYQYTHADPSARFDIGSIQADISGTLGAVSNINITNSNIESRFAPLYTTNFGGELPNNGFIEGAQQNSDISVAKAVSPETPSPKVLALQYGGETDRLRLDISRSGDPDTAVSEIDLSTILENNFGNTTYPFNTLLTQEGGTIEDISQTFLSSHISYTLDGRDVVYNGDVIGKDNYHDTDIDNTTSQSGIKVVGLTSGERTTALTDDQFSDDVTILGKLTKSTSRKDIQSSVFSVIKGVAPENGSNRITRLDSLGWSNNTDGKKLVNDSVLYFKNSDTDATNFELGNGSNEIVGGKKTIVVEGGNLYIRSNMSYADTDNDILGIVVLQDEQGRGGNLYIHPDVTNIVGTIYVDKSVISYNDIEGELDGNTRAEILRNQLYIFGSLFSENTIGGSRDIDEEGNPICPYYMSRSDCETSVEAQKYDLNYLRRYFVADSDNDGIKDTPSGNIGVPSTHSNYANYYQFPVVVEYNSRIQSTPPPLFD